MYHIIIYFFINIYYRHWKTLFWSKKRILTQACTLCFKIAEVERHSWWSASSYISVSYLLPQHHTAQILIIISLLDFNIVREEKKDLKNRFEWYRNICKRTRPIFTKCVIERPIATASRFHKLWLFHEQQLDAALRLKLATRRTATRKLIDAQENSGGGEDGSRTRARARASGRRRVLFTWILHALRCILDAVPPFPPPSFSSLSYGEGDEVSQRDLASKCRVNPFEPCHRATGF